MSDTEGPALAVVGRKLFLLKEETVGRFTFEKHTLLTVTATDGESFTVTGRARHPWRYEGEQAEARFPIAGAGDSGRFLWLVEQEIDGLLFSPEPPKEIGDYWFYGITNEDRSQLMLGFGQVREGMDDHLSFWFFGEVEFFSSTRFSMEGLWAKAWVPQMPGREGAFTLLAPGISPSTCRCRRAAWRSIACAAWCSISSASR